MDLGKASAVAAGLAAGAVTDAERVELISMAEDLKNQLAAAQHGWLSTWPSRCAAGTAT